MTAAEELILVEAAIAAYYARLTNDDVVEYQLPAGVRVRRREGGASTIMALLARRDQLARRVSVSATSPVRLAKLGVANATSR